jgi:hypothetical protein
MRHSVKRKQRCTLLKNKSMLNKFSISDSTQKHTHTQTHTLNNTNKKKHTSMVHVINHAPRLSYGLKVNVALESVTLLLRIRKVAGLNLSMQTDYFDLPRRPPQFLHVKSRTVHIMFDIPSKSFTIQQVIRLYTA